MYYPQKEIRLDLSYMHVYNLSLTTVTYFILFIYFIISPPVKLSLWDGAASVVHPSIVFL